MKATIKGFAMFHRGSYDDADDKAKFAKGQIKEEDVKKIPFHKMVILERGDNGPQSHTVKVQIGNVPAALRLDEQPVEVVVDMKETNYSGVKSMVFNFLSGKVAPLRTVGATT